MSTIGEFDGDNAERYQTQISVTSWRHRINGAFVADNLMRLLSTTRDRKKVRMEDSSFKKNFPRNKKAGAHTSRNLNKRWIFTVEFPVQSSETRQALSEREIERERENEKERNRGE